MSMDIFATNTASHQPKKCRSNLDTRQFSDLTISRKKIAAIPGVRTLNSLLCPLFFAAWLVAHQASDLEDSLFIASIDPGITLRISFNRVVR